MKQAAILFALSLVISLTPIRSFGNEKAEKLYIEAVKLIEAGEHRKGNTKLNQAIAAVKNEKAEELYIEAMKLIEAGEYRKGKAKLNQAIDLNADFALAYSARGALEVSDVIPPRDLSGTSLLSNDLDRAIEIDPSDERAFINRGFFRMQHSVFNAGILADFNTALQLNPKSVEALVGLGNYYAIKSMPLMSFYRAFDTAREYYQKALSMDPNNEPARKNMETLEKIKEARSLFQSVTSNFQCQIEECGLSAYAGELIDALYSTLNRATPTATFLSCKAFFKKE